MVGMRDVAKEAGVSLSTVSLVVNKTGYVSDDMRARVKAAMKELNYVPNELAHEASVFDLFEGGRVLRQINGVVTHAQL